MPQKILQVFMVFVAALEITPRYNFAASSQIEDI